MLRYALLRLAGAVPTLFGVIVLAFLMVHAAPGGPFDDERALPADVRADIEKYYRLDEPLPQQFMRYVGGLLRGDFGPSYRYRDRPVCGDDRERLSGVVSHRRAGDGARARRRQSGAGIVAALRHGSWIDRTVRRRCDDRYFDSGVRRRAAARLAAGRAPRPVPGRLERRARAGAIRVAGPDPRVTADRLHRAADARRHARRPESRLSFARPVRRVCRWRVSCACTRCGRR